MLALGLLAAGIVVFQKANASTFYYDEWTTIVHRRGRSLDVFFRPHNDHLSFVIMAFYKAWLLLFGLDNRWPYALLAALGNLGCGLLLYRLLAPHAGAWPAVGAALVLVTLGPAWEAVLWPFQIGLFIGLGAVFAALIALEREDSRGDLLAAALLVIGIGSASIALPGFIAAGAYIVARRQDVVARLARVVAPAVVLYAVWYLAYRDQIQQYDLTNGERSLFSLDRLFSVPEFVMTLVSACGAAALGLKEEFGPPIVVGFVFWLIASFLRIPRLPPIVWAGVALAVSYPLLTALGRAGQNPASSRYLYSGVAFLLLLGGLALTRRPTGRALVAGAAVAIFALWSNLGELRRADQIGLVGERLEVSLAMLELARGSVAPNFQPDPTWAPDINAAVYFPLIDKYGSPAATLGEVTASSPQLRGQADDALARALNVVPQPVAVPPGRSELPPPAGLRVAEGQGTIRGSGACMLVRPTGAPVAVDAPLSAAGLIVGPRGAPVDVRLRRFGDGFAADPRFSIQAGVPALVRVAADRAEQPWHVRLSSGGPFVVCSAEQ